MVILTLSHRTNTHKTSSHKVHKDHNLLSMAKILTPLISLNITGQSVKFVERLVIMLQIATIGWILLTKAKIHLLSWLQWPMLPTSTSLRAIMIPGLLILVLQTILLPTSIISTSQYLSKGLNKFLLGMVKICLYRTQVILNSTLNFITLGLEMSYMFQELLVICFLFINFAFITTAVVILILTSCWFRIYLRGESSTRARVKMEYIQFIPQDFSSLSTINLLLIPLFLL